MCLALSIILLIISLGLFGTLLFINFDSDTFAVQQLDSAANICLILSGLIGIIYSLNFCTQFDKITDFECLGQGAEVQNLENVAADVQGDGNLPSDDEPPTQHHTKDQAKDKEGGGD
jgi:hypothetical protein